jgi:hypothetical protein
MSTETGVVARMWLHMLSKGGRWGVAEMMQVTGLQRRRADTLINLMALREQVVKYPDASRANGVAFGVTLGCKPPTQVRLSEILNAINAPAENESEAA